MISESDATYLANVDGEVNPKRDFKAPTEAELDWAYGSHVTGRPTPKLAHEGLPYYVQLPDGRRGLMVVDEFIHTGTDDDASVVEDYGNMSLFKALQVGMDFIGNLLERHEGTEPVIGICTGPFGRHVMGVFVEYKEPEVPYCRTVRPFPQMVQPDGGPYVQSPRRIHRIRAVRHPGACRFCRRKRRRSGIGP